MILFEIIIIAPSTSTAVPYAQDEDSSLLRAILGRTTQEVKDYTAQFEDQCKIDESLGTALNAPENKSVLDILAMRERRLDAALVGKSNATTILTNFCIAEKSAVHVQSEAAAALVPPLGVVATTSNVVPSTSPGISDKKDFETEATGTARRMEGPLK